MDHVGAIFGIDMSRMARNNKDWHHLMELCAIFGTILADEDRIYDPALSTCKNGRFSEVFCNLAPSSVVLGHGFSQKARVFDGFPC